MLLILAFLVTHVLYAPLARLLLANCLGGLADFAGVPILSIVVTATFLVLTPVTNGLVRFVGNQADMYSPDHAREPDGDRAAAHRRRSGARPRRGGRVAFLRSPIDRAGSGGRWSGNGGTNPTEHIATFVALV
ncbi:MAG TPA: hypothetical protein VF774_19705 [Pseudoduganella sp.]